MKKDRLLPLTETSYYILLALRRPAHGYEIMQTAEALSGGGVRIAAGTMYGAIENLLGYGLIAAVPSEDKRRKVYGLTAYGEEILRQDIARTQQKLRAAQEMGVPV